MGFFAKHDRNNDSNFKGRWKVRNFFAKMNGKDEPKGNRSNFIYWLRVFGHRCENRLATLFGELGLRHSKEEKVINVDSLYFKRGRIYSAIPGIQVIAD